MPKKFKTRFLLLFSINIVFSIILGINFKNTGFTIEVIGILLFLTVYTIFAFPKQDLKKIKVAKITAMGTQIGFMVLMFINMLIKIIILN